MIFISASMCYYKEIFFFYHSKMSNDCNNIIKFIIGIQKKTCREYLLQGQLSQTENYIMEKLNVLKD